MFASALDMREPLNLYNPGFLTRTTRWLRVQRHLSGQDAGEVSAWWPFDSNSPRHASAIVRVMTGSPGMHGLPQLFAATYLAAKFPSLQMPRSVRRLAEALTREATRTPDEQSHEEATATSIDTVEGTTSHPTEADEASDHWDHSGGDQ
jgi:hypothetical protein